MEKEKLGIYIRNIYSSFRVRTNAYGFGVLFKKSLCCSNCQTVNNSTQRNKALVHLCCSSLPLSFSLLLHYSFPSHQWSSLSLAKRSSWQRIVTPSLHLWFLSFYSLYVVRSRPLSTFQFDKSRDFLMQRRYRLLLLWFWNLCFELGLFLLLLGLRKMDLNFFWDYYFGFEKYIYWFGFVALISKCMLNLIWVSWFAIEILWVCYFDFEILLFGFRKMDSKLFGFWTMDSKLFGFVALISKLMLLFGFLA